LPGGHHGLSREQVSESQRERLLAAVAHVVAAEGYRQTTITAIVKAAAVSSRAFYEHFDSKEECFLAAFDAVVDHLHDLLHEATAAADDWPHEAIAALRAGLEFFAANPDLARLCLVEPVLATPRIAARFRAAIMAGVPFLAAGRILRPEGAELPASTEDSLLGGLAVLVSRQVGRVPAGALPRSRAGARAGPRDRQRRELLNAARVPTPHAISRLTSSPPT
jgi:AcrR family transcriptional regulator